MQLAGRLDRPLRVKATARATDGETQAASGEVDGEGRATVELDASRNGAVLVDVALEDPVSGQTLEALPDAAVVDVVPRAAILYAQGSSGTLARSLRKGGWTLNVVPASRLDAHADALDGYHAVVLDDVAITDASPRFWNALVAAVQNRGLGLMVLGGERSFARGGYRRISARVGSARDRRSRRCSISPRASCSSWTSRAAWARAAAAWIASSWPSVQCSRPRAASPPRDSLGLVVFDVVPRVLIPLGPATAGTSALERDWHDEPEWRNKACTRARRGDRRARALGCRTAHADPRHRRFRRRRTARRTARAARSFSNRDDRSGRRAGRRRKRAGTARRRGNRRCASRERGRRIAARHALRSSSVAGRASSAARSPCRSVRRCRSHPER